MLKKLFWNTLGMVLIGLIAAGLTLIINEFIWEYTNVFDSALVAAMIAMICYVLGMIGGKFAGRNK